MQFTTTPFVSVFTLLYRRKFASMSAADAAFAVASWTFLVYLTCWNFFSETFRTILLLIYAHQFHPEGSFWRAALVLKSRTPMRQKCASQACSPSLSSRSAPTVGRPSAASSSCPPGWRCLPSPRRPRTCSSRQGSSSVRGKREILKWLIYQVKVKYSYSTTYYVH